MKIFRIDPAEEPEVVSGIRESGQVGVSYFVLLVLAIVIATFGLLANSTATVIGAMIVAPLMGPILGLSLGLVSGNTRDFRRAMLAEGLGVLLCLVLASSIGWLVGTRHIDFTQSEIVARIHPTLLDLAVGFAAGLAGAYATVNRKISGSIAGVAIAVALVPPLCVSGLCLGARLWSPSLGAFMLFLANFLTIHLAAAVMFSLAGLGHWGNVRREPGLFRALLMNLILLVFTGAFLTRQLLMLIRERQAEQVSREVITAEFARLSGVHLDALQVRATGSRITLDVLARAPQEVSVGLAQSLQAELQQRLNTPVELRIGTALASYVTPAGRLFAPDQATPDPRAAWLAEAQRVTQAALRSYPGVELAGLQQSGEEALFLSVRSPYVFDAELVRRLQEAVVTGLRQKLPDQKPLPLTLTVRTTLIQDYTAEGLQDVPVEHTLTEEETRQRSLDTALQVALRREVSQVKGARLLEARLGLVGADSVELEARVLSLRPLDARQVKKWALALGSAVGRPVKLQVSNELGRVLSSP